MKKCPACAEDIQDEAIKCKHCGERFGQLTKGHSTDSPMKSSKHLPFSPVDWYFEAFQNYANFSSRARRKEFWTFLFFNVIIVFGLRYVDNSLGESLSFEMVYDLIVLIPSISLCIRRMHDTDHRAWWVAVPIVNVVYFLRRGTKGDNRFGADPRAPFILWK